MNVNGVEHACTHRRAHVCARVRILTEFLFASTVFRLEKTERLRRRAMFQALVEFS